PKQLQEVGTVLRVCRAEPSKMLIADLRAEAVLCLVSSSGVIHRDPGGACEASPQHIAGFVKEGFLAVIEQANNLPLGDENTERLHHLHQSWHSDLSLIILRQNEPAQFRSEVPLNAVRQWGRQNGAVRGKPALTTKRHNMGADDQVLNRETRVPFEPRASGRGNLDDPFLVNRQLCPRGPTL